MQMKPITINLNDDFFCRSKMGNEHAKPSERLRSINREVYSLRSSLRGSTRSLSKTAQEQMVQDLAKYSTETNKLRGKVKEARIDDVQRNISYAVNEILSTKPTQELDKCAVETDSIVQMPVNKRHSTSKGSLETPAKKTKNNTLNKQGIPTIQDIENKLQTLKPQITVAIESKDSRQLRVYQETIKVLATYLEMIDVPENSPLGEKKERLISASTSLYQKINKAMKEIRRSADLSYLTKQSLKEKATKELESLRHSLDGTDLLLKEAIRDEDTKRIQRAQKSLTDISDKLPSIEVADDESKNIKLHMMDKIAWLKKYIEQATKKGSQSDLTKAQTSYEDIIKTIASGRDEDENDVEVKLQSLQTFVESIKDEDKNMLKQKSQLLNNINESYALIHSRKASKSRDAVDRISRPPGSCLRQVEVFYNSWKCIEATLTSSQIPKDELNRIDGMLKKIQISILETRKVLEESRDDQPKLTSKWNRSTPNLAVSPRMYTKFPSSYSIDRSENLAIKTKAKYYEIDAPQIQNINQQLKSLQVQDNGFSQIEEIKTQVNYIKEKFDESQNKQHLKNKLESYVGTLEGYMKHYNPATVKHASKVLEDVTELLKRIDGQNILNQRRNSIEDVFENVVVLQEKVEQLEKEVDLFSGKVSDQAYTNLKHRLIECRGFLENVEIPQRYDMILKQREEVLKKVYLLMNLLDKKANNVYYEDPEIKEMKRILSGLKEKVNRFTGAYKGVLYNKLEKELNKLLLDASEKLEDKPLADLIVKESEKYLKILEHRAMKDQSFRSSKSPKTEDEENLSKLKLDLQTIKKDIDTTPSNGINLFLGLKSRLDLVKLGLDQLKHLDENDEHQKHILYNEVDTLKNVVDAKIALSKQSIKQWPLQESRKLRAEEELNNIEESMKKLKGEIENFVGTTSDDKFYELDESSIKLILRMDDMDFPKDSELHDKKIRLLKEIYHCGDLLDKRAKETEDLIHFEREIEDIENNFERYTKSTEDLEKLATKVMAMKASLNGNNFNTLLRARQKKCSGKMDEMVRQINKRTGKIDPEKELQRLEQQFRAVVQEIECFSGTHVDRRYYELDGSVSELFSKVDTMKVPENSELYQKKHFLLKEIYNYSNILDKKAKATEVYRTLRKRLDAVKSRLENHRGSKDDLKIIENELKAIRNQLDQAHVKDDLKKELIKRFETLMTKLNSLQATSEPKGYLSSSSFIADLEKSKTTAPKSYKEYFEYKLSMLEQELEKLKKKIREFNDVESSEGYKVLDDGLLKINNQLKKLDIPKESEFYRRKEDLKQNVVDSLTLLDDRLQDVESIAELEKELDEISGQVNGELNDELRGKLDEKLIGLQVKIGKLTVNEDLQSRKDACTNRIFALLRKLKENPGDDNVFSSDDSSGTFV
ncbi:unnamed protein product [Acanthoscelides obtectus]|uniref:Uncharacterized protein n=1 Tax=Acanthoscelides obtectus TaxID=200917 RepID=A0A9P0Q3M6_ACAOB|nr:unnamed protein product [Acanthoscelides obtectus]CAK1637744.1 hypothetical protein AOBTE_LOCUS10173 [Acanthoscelides obtectus]